MPKKLKIVYLVLLGVLLGITGCDDKASVNIYDKHIVGSPIPCMSLSIYPKDENTEKTLRKLYDFSEKCEYRLELSYKSDIKCNATQNAALKATSNFPTAFIRLELKKGIRLLYSYYRDLGSRPTASDVKKAFRRLEDDIGLRKK